MRDLWILALVVFLLLILPLTKPFFRALRQFSGLNWFYPISLGIMVCLFPVYGFRLECVPLLICVVVVNIAAFFEYIAGQDNAVVGNSYYRKKACRPGVAIVTLIITTGIAVYFSPALDADLTTDRVRTAMLFDERRQARFSVRIYDVEQAEPKGFMVVVPPLIDSFHAVDKICAEIRKNGFVSVAFSREKAALKTRPLTPLNELLTMFAVLKNGTVLEKANQTGRYWEKERLSDIEFIFSNMGDIAQTGSKTPVFAVGYGAGGSALISAVSSDAFITANPSLKAVVAVESRLWSSFYHEEDPVEMPEDLPWFAKVRLKAALWFKSRLPKKVDRLTDPPVMRKPALFLTSDAVLRAKERDGRYIALLNALHANGAAPALLLAGEGMKAPDYLDYPAVQPLYSAAFLGAGKDLRARMACVVNTAAAITGFALFFMDEDAPKMQGFRTGMSENAYVEKNQAWNSADFMVY
ncbi:MAG: hypothetical protein LBB48_00620 [Treponema sp.]|jgi:alpha-beta hydrolase superfamily lysophospholipase|nr:hypothetical protein [Treponema sp.]